MDYRDDEIEKALVDAVAQAQASASDGNLATVTGMVELILRKAQAVLPPAVVLSLVKNRLPKVQAPDECVVALFNDIFGALQIYAPDRVGEFEAVLIKKFPLLLKPKNLTKEGERVMAEKIKRMLSE